jgi:GNAT superfamily N-acetyltransferase
MENQRKFHFCHINSYGDQLDEYKKLHNLLFRGAYVSKEWIKWYHNIIGSLDNKFSGTRTYAVYNANELIGIWSVEPKLFCGNEGNYIKTGRCFAVGIHPDYRRLGLFVSLSKYAIEQERNRAEFEYIIGFPQTGRSVIGGHLKAGWENVQEIGIYSVNLANEDGLYSRSAIQDVRNFSEIESPKGICGSYEENQEYRNIRWLQHPYLHYMCFKHEDAFIILKPYSNFCHILDIKGNMKNVLILLETSRSIAKRHGWIELNMWCANNELYKNQVKKAGFENGANYGVPISMIAVRINAQKPLQLENCHIQMGVEEGY